jgi:hypothetical protein
MASIVQAHWHLFCRHRPAPEGCGRPSSPPSTDMPRVSVASLRKRWQTFNGDEPECQYQASGAQRGVCAPGSTQKAGCAGKSHSRCRCRPPGSNHPAALRGRWFPCALVRGRLPQTGKGRLGCALGGRARNSLSASTSEEVDSEVPDSATIVLGQ